MRILWLSNSPFVTSGYGTQTASACAHLKQLGHEVAIFAFWGLEGSRVDWGDIPIYPNDPRDYGIKNALMFYEDFKADIFISLVDVWVLGGLDPQIKHVPWFPVDHDPPPPAVLEVLKRHPGIVKPICQSKWGQRKIIEAGIDCYYIPNDFDTKLYAPNAEWWKIGRERYGWEDKFVIGTVATNHAERKNYTAAMEAVQMFERRHKGEVVYYMHTNPHDERGIDLLRLRENLGIQNFTFFPSSTQSAIGIDRETMARMYNALDVFLLPTKGEGFCRPIIEAQSCGVPVITTRCTAQAELLGGGWFIEKLIPQWTQQSSWQFDCHPEEIAELLEQAYQAKKDGSIVAIQEKARQKALEYDEERVYKYYWPAVLKDLEKKIKEPRNCEGVQPWRLAFIPKTCVPRKVLDIGCGITQPYKKALEHLGEYVGVDSRNGTGVRQCDAHHLPFGTKEFGFVWMSEVLEHVKDPIKVLGEAKRVGVHGVCLFSTPQNPFFKGDPDHKIVKMSYTTTQTGDGLIVW